MFFQKKNNFCFIDVGTYKTACFVCAKVENSFRVLSHSVIKTRGMKSGSINDAGELKASILAAVFDAEQSASVDIEEVVLSLPATEVFLKKAVVRDYLFGKQVSEEDIEKLLNKSFVEIDSSKFEVVHNFASRFCLDDITVVKNPENLFADSIEAEILLVYTKLSYLINISTILAGCHLKPIDFMLDSYAASTAIASDALNKALVIDLGCGSSKYTYFKDGTMVGAGCIKVGGNNITRDIANYFSISFDEAERLKTVHGDLLQCVGEDLVSVKQFSKQSTNEPNSIKKSILNQVILARVEEIAELVSNRAKKAEFSQVLLTGGGAKLPGTKEVFSQMFGCKAFVPRVGIKIGDERIEKDPSYSTIIGMMKVFLNSKVGKQKTFNVNPVVRVLSWLKKNF